MRFGICTDIQNIDEVASLGYDYVEAKLNVIAVLDEDAFSAIVEQVHASPICVERCCLLLPKSMQVIGDRYQEAEMVAYLKAAYARMQAIGADLVVFGSGKSRTFDASMRWQQAFKHLVDVTKVIGMVGADYGIRIAIEPLNRLETNLINTLTEAAVLQACVGLPNVGLLADSYHMASEHEDWNHIVQVAPLMHTHIALHEGRRYPTMQCDEVDSFMTALQAAGYDASMSIEGKSDDWQSDAKSALSILKQACEGRR